MDIAKTTTQLQQLDELAQAGVLSAAAHQAARGALEQAMLGQLLGQTPAQSRRAGLTTRWLWALAGAGLLGAGTLAYSLATLEGSGPAMAPTASVASMPAAAPAAASAPHALGDQQMLAMVQGLAERLQARPDDAAGWAMLARSYATLGRHAEALPAYVKALALSPDDAGLKADYAAALTRNAAVGTAKP